MKILRTIESSRAQRRKRRVLERKLAKEDQATTELRADIASMRELVAATRGRKRIALDRIEKWSGEPSFFATARMFQRINGYRTADDSINSPAALVVNLRDRAFVHSFANSHSALVSKSGGECEELTVHAFKGTVGLIEATVGTERFVTDAKGNSVSGPDSASGGQDSSVPLRFEELIESSGTLSAHVPFPYAQIVWKGSSGVLELVSIDVAPARVPVLTPEWDAKLGLLIEQAHARMLAPAFRAGMLENRTPTGVFRYEEES